MNKERVISQRMTKKYFDALKVAKAEIESNVFVQVEWLTKFKLSHRTKTTLKDLGIVKNLSDNRKRPIYEWNNRIPVTMLLAKKIILENHTTQYGHIKNTELNKLNKPVVKKIVKQSSRPTTKQIVKPIQVTKKVSDVGLIRKFLRWIY
jgi:hypothetical protein